MCRNSAASVIVTCRLPDLTRRYLCLAGTSVTPPANKWGGEILAFVLRTSPLCLSPGLIAPAPPVWIQSDADKRHSRSINVSLCMKWFVIVLVCQQHGFAVLIVLFFSPPLSDARITSTRSGSKRDGVWKRRAASGPSSSSPETF